jgi:hypothetical protein
MGHAAPALGGPALDGAGNLLGVTMARMNDIAAPGATSCVRVDGPE